MPVLLALILAGCMGPPEAVASLEDLEIESSLPSETPATILPVAPSDTAPATPSVVSEEALPAIPMGRSTFLATDPGTVNLAAGRVQLVEFFAYWCSVCKAIAPTVHGLEELYQDQVSFVYLDRDDPATLSLQNQLGYIYQPHFFLLDESGNVLGEWRGYVEGDILQLAIVEAVQ
ncbi:MAG: thioredoxin domain-containing protein [Anaerolineales bacterium]